MIENFSFVRLEPSSERKPFNCGDDDLNEFFLQDSKDHSNQLLAVTYALENGNNTVAYFSVLNDSIRREDTSRSKFDKMLKLIPREKRYHSHPAVKIGRFAVAEAYQGNEIGTKLIDFIKVFFIKKNKTGCRFITVDAYNKERTISFYKKNGFDFLTMADPGSDTRLMYFDLYPMFKSLSEN